MVSKRNNFTHFKPGKYEPFFSPLTTFSVLLSNTKTNLLVSEDATSYKGLITFYFSAECFTHPGSCLIFFIKGYVHEVLDVLSGTSLPDLNVLGTKYWNNGARAT